MRATTERGEAGATQPVQGRPATKSPQWRRHPGGTPTPRRTISGCSLHVVDTGGPWAPARAVPVPDPARRTAVRPFPPAGARTALQRHQHALGVLGDGLDRRPAIAPGRVHLRGPGPAGAPAVAAPQPSGLFCDRRGAHTLNVWVEDLGVLAALTCRCFRVTWTTDMVVDVTENADAPAAGPRAVILDFYGTLARATSRGPSAEEVFGRHGLAFDPPTWDRHWWDAVGGLDHREVSRTREDYR